DFSVNVEAIPDSPEISGIPPTVFIELGGNASIPISVYDPDTEFPDIQTSKSWAEYENGSLLIEPVSPGIHILEVTASDGTHNSSISLEVHVSAKPDLVIESLEIRKDGAVGDSFVIGDVVEIVGYVRNEGRGDAYNVVFHCKVDGVLIGNEKIESIAPGELKMVICDFQLDKTAAQLSIESEIDATDSIEEVIETNNVFSGTILVEGRVVNSDRTDMNRIVTILSVLTIFGSIFLIQMGPIRLKKEFGEEK
ncbi:MAG TPA: CARDB domain-containing protein, partial [Candidatus Thalassarchaeaceae archaeon]|nr:CARDB domain-containing protein [Candidatus Thalassarchaeaceae archaeon]